MTKADVIEEISKQTGIEKIAVSAAVESFFKVIRDSMSKGENVYVRGFGSFHLKKRARKTGRNISKNTTIIIPAHYIPHFKPAKTFTERVKSNNKINEE